METNNYLYETPHVEILEVVVEQCFAASYGTENLNPETGNWY